MTIREEYKENSENLWKYSIIFLKILKIVLFESLIILQSFISIKTFPIIKMVNFMKATNLRQLIKIKVVYQTICVHVYLWRISLFCQLNFSLLFLNFSSQECRGLREFHFVNDSEIIRNGWKNDSLLRFDWIRIVT